MLQNDEVDILGIDKENKKMIFGEVKFSKLSKNDILDIKNSLKRKAQGINRAGFKEDYIVICLDCDSECPGVIRFSELIKR